MKKLESIYQIIGEEPIFADLINQEIQIPFGTVIDKDIDTHTIFKKLIILEIKNGLVVSEKQMVSLLRNIE